jgi:hypothetical protein
MVGTDSPNRCGTKGGKTIAKWIRDGLGISREEVTQPMHWFRHYVRSALLAKKVDRKIRNMITGHAGNSHDESERYEHPDIPAMVEAINLLPDPLAALAEAAEFRYTRWRRRRVRELSRLNRSFTIGSVAANRC